MIPLCGGNIDTTILGRCLERGLASDGRLCCFVVRVQDTPGGCAKLTALLAALGVRYVYLSIESLKIRDLFFPHSIKDIFHERAWLYSDIYGVDVRIVACLVFFSMGPFR